MTYYPPRIPMDDRLLKSATDAADRSAADGGSIRGTTPNASATIAGPVTYGEPGAARRNHAMEQHITQLSSGLFMLRLPDDVCTLLYPTNIVVEIGKAHDARLAKEKTQHAETRDSMRKYEEVLAYCNARIQSLGKQKTDLDERNKILQEEVTRLLAQIKRLKRAPKAKRIRGR